MILTVPIKGHHQNKSNIKLYIIFHYNDIVKVFFKGTVQTPIRLSSMDYISRIKYGFKVIKLCNIE